MWVLNGDCSRLYGNEEGWEDADGTKHGGTEDKACSPGFQQVVLAEEPVIPGFRTIGNSIEMVGGVPKRIWHQEPIPQKTPGEVEVDRVREILGQITLLEDLETKRRIAEAMSDDAGGTADGRAWLAANRVSIAVLRTRM